MNNMDLQATLNALENGHIDNFDPNYEHIENLKFCVRLADRLKRGEVSKKMHIAGVNEFDLPENVDTIYEAMTTQLLKEIEDE